MSYCHIYSIKNALTRKLAILVEQIYSLKCQSIPTFLSKYQKYSAFTANNFQEECLTFSTLQIFEIKRKI